MIRRRWTIGLLMLSCCAHGAATPHTRLPPTAVRENSVAPKAAVAASPGLMSSEPPEDMHSRIESYMVDHYLIATLSRDAVIAGDLEALRGPLRSFAEYDYADIAPGGWMPWIAQVQEVAGLTADAETLELAALGVATMARTCSACHTAQGRGPRLVALGVQHPPPRSNTTVLRMGEHMWAAERLWEGLIAPSEEAWKAGAAMLAKIPTDAPSSSEPRSAAFESALLANRALGQQALEAESAADRANVYGRLLAGCSGCHAQVVGQHAAAAREHRAPGASPVLSPAMYAHPNARSAPAGTSSR